MGTRSESRTLRGVALIFFGGIFVLVGVVLIAVALLAAVKGAPVTPAHVAAAVVAAAGLIIGVIGVVAFRKGRQIYDAIAS